MALFSHYEACPKCQSLGRDTRGDNLAMYADGSGHCFSCRYHVFPRAYTTHFLTKKEPHAKGLLPDHTSSDIPAKAWEWLLQYGLPMSYWKDSLCYSEEDSRLIFKVGKPLQFSIGRYFGDLPGRRKWYVWGDCHKHCEVISSGSGPIVLVEDLISAHKVGNVSISIPLFGTAVHPCHVYYLSTVSNPIYFWLDKDQEGPVKKQAVKLQSILNRPVDIIVTDKDPKEYSFNQIKEALYERQSST